jgi:hypothetical protein
LLETEPAFKALESLPLGSDIVRLDGSFDAPDQRGAKVYAPLPRVAANRE